MNRALLLVGFGLIACDGAAAPDDGDSDGACTALPDGAYDASGSCFGMVMGAQLEMDVAGCAFDLGGWSMTMGGEPRSGSIVGDQVTLMGGDFDGCTGTIEDDSVSGTCEDGCAWELRHGG